MIFKDAFNISELKSLICELSSSITAIEENGYCSMPSPEDSNIKNRAVILQKKLKECNEEFDNILDEMAKWYSY